jgi:hypothetical protein
MPDQQILWTALPRRADSGSLEVDVLVSPRLGVAAPPNSEFELSQFPDFEHWPTTLADRLTFQVELADGSRHDAVRDPATTLDLATWDHLFRATTFVRPWTFRDLSDRPIHSYSVRFITAYLRDLYTDLGRRFPTTPPPLGELNPFVETVGPVVDVRVDKEREPPPREDHEIPVPDPQVPPGPATAADGCSGSLWRLVVGLCKRLRPICRRLPERARYLGVVLFRLLRGLLEPAPAPPVDPTPPKATVPRVVHASPYIAKPPITAAQLPPLLQLDAEMAATKAIAPVAPQGAIADALATRDLTFDFARAKRFFERPESETPPAAPPEVPRFDFHQAIGALGDYPELMRRLGLVIRLRFDRPAAAPGTIRVIPSWDGQLRATDIAPRTRCELDRHRFYAAHRPDSDFADGVLDLDGTDDRLATDAPRFDIVQVDSDGAAMKAILTAASLERRRQLDVLMVKAVGRPARETVPALRSAGLAIVRADRGWHVHQHLAAAAQLQLPQPAAVAGEPASLVDELFAEDLVRGYRVEVRQGGGEWLSLCERVGTYDLVDDSGQFVRRALKKTDHGYVKRTSATSAPGDAQPLYVHEALARWTGWSLVAQRPGKTLENHVEGPPPPGQPYDRPEEPRNEARTEFRLVTRFDAKPGTLPRLRFGAPYAMRAICVDLCGEGLAALKPSAPHTSEVVYRRYEPAGPPALLALRAFRPGESLERLVVVSDFDRDSTTYDQDEFGSTPAAAAAQRTRHVFVPKASQDMAELHGKLDASFGDGADPDVGYRISLRSSGTFAKPTLIDVHTVDVNNPVGTITFGTPQDVGDYWINTEDATLPTPYLPDPVVAGVALRGVPGLVDHVVGDPLTVRQVRHADDPAVTEPLLQVPYRGSWPDLQAFRLRVAEAAALQPPRWDAADRLLTVYLPKAGMRTIRYSSYLSGEALDDHGLWDWLDDSDPAGVLRSQAEAGAHWMISPPRELVLVHAVQRPLEPARFTRLQATRTEIGQTTAVLEQGTLSVHQPSTGRIDVIARWDEYLDDPVDGFKIEPHESVACDFPVDDGWSDSMAFPPSSPLAERARHEFGDTRHRRVKYLIRATTSFREYLRVNPPPGPLTRDTAAGQEVELDVLNSARPLPPAVLYAMPTFDWPTSPPAAGWSQHVQMRGGGGLRVYLDRPWYQSGEGELLGIVLQDIDPLPDDQRSRYGLDAIWSGAAPPEAVRLEPHHFPNHVQTEQVSLAQGGPGAVVVGFSPEWDTTRKLWFCDIELDVGALPWNYWPFVRLAFVRHQPKSLDDAKVSKVVLSEFGQVAPERSLSLTWQDPDHVLATLRGRGPAGPRPPRAAFRIQTTAVPTGQDADELDWAHAAGHPEQVDWQNFFQLVEPVDPVSDGDLLWKHLVTLPGGRGSQRMRLEVTEHEFLVPDEELGRGIPRITYAAHVPLD